VTNTAFGDLSVNTGKWYCVFSYKWKETNHSGEELSFMR